MHNKTLADNQMDQFVSLFNGIEKTITFVKNWKSDVVSLAGVVNHPEMRIIMANGERARMIDNYNRRVVLLGTDFGTLVIYPSSPMASRHHAAPLAYVVTETFAESVSRFFDKIIPAEGLLTEMTTINFLDENFFQVINTVAEHCRERHLYVGDGMEVFQRPKKKTRHVAKPAKSAPRGYKAEMQVMAEKVDAMHDKAAKPKRARPKRPVKTSAADIVKADQAAFAVKQLVDEEHHPALAA